jgi:L-alanine-DL-glutamate epimerase-like enolase superfamily enzyme
MKIKKIDVMAADLPLARPIKMSGVEIATSENVFARIETDDGHVGWGEASAAPTMTGETVESMVAAVEYLAPFMDGRDPAAFEENLEEMNWRMYGNASAKTIMEMALYDIAGKAQQKSVAELLGTVHRTEIPVLYMLATGNIDVDVAEASERAQAGVTHMKIKVGGKPVEQDIERTIAIRRAVNGGVQLSADCNQGWTHEEALAYVGAASESLDFLEQPIMGYDVEGMAMIAAASACPIGADEGLHSVGDVHKHNDMGAAKGGSLKMIKLGGVTRAYQAAELFDELGMHVNMAGKVAESSVSSAAVLQLAAAAPSIEWGVSVTCQYLKEDVCKDSLDVVNGQVTVPTGAGLGVEVDEDALSKFVRN